MAPRLEQRSVRAAGMSSPRLFACGQVSWQRFAKGVEKAPGTFVLRVSWRDAERAVVGGHAERRSNQFDLL